MNTLLQWGGHPAVDRLGWTLLHFLWQGAVIAALFAVAQTGLRRRSSHARYWTGCLALALMLAAPVITFLALGAERTVPVALAAGGTRSSAARPPALDGQGGQSGQRGQPRAPIPLPAYLNPNLNLNLPAPPSLLSGKLIPGLVLVWLLGVSALSIRLLFSSLHVARLKRRGHEPPGEPWLTRLDRLRAALQISRPVRLVKSFLIEVPAVVGWLRPVILLPAASLAGLTPAQLEAILAHELAHVRRHDYLVNLLQNALETLLFYHPAVWWISSCVRAEREICCDEIAVKLCGDRLVYAQALAALEQLRAGRPALALGADGSSLLERIRRLSGAPGGGSFQDLRRAGGALVAALVAVILVALLHHPSNNAKAQGTRPAAPNQTNTAAGPVNSSKPGANPSGLSLVIRCTNEVLKVGDEIPIEFIISNHSAEDFSYLDPMPQLMVPDEVNLVAKTTTGESVPSPSLPSRSTQLARQILVLHPGQSFSKIIPLNFWALIKEPGQYQVLGAYLGRNHLFSPGPHNQRIALVNSAPITITVQPRSKKEMDDYIGDLTNQVAARLAIKAAQAQFDDSVLDELLLKLMYTCNPKIIPTLVRIMDEAGPHSGDWGWFGREALLCYVPKTEESWQSILQEASRHALTWHMEELLAEYNFNGAEMKPIIERALAPDKMDEWRFGAMLAASSFYDDAFTPRLIAIATDSNAPRKYTGRIIGEELSWNTVRGAAMAALAMNRTDEGVKALRSLLNDPDPQLCVLLAQAILGGYDSRLNMPSSPTGRHLLPGDFDAREVRPLIERMLASASSSYKVEGLRLVERFGDDAWTPQLVSLAMKPGDIGTRYSAIQALAMNRTDEGVKTLKTLLHDPDAAISQIVEWSIRAAYTAHGDALGRPLRADDFDAKYQVPEGAPPTNPASTNNGGAIPSSESNRAEDGLKKLAPSNTGEPQVVKLIQLAHSDPTNIVAEVSKALTNTVTIIPDFRTHQVIVRATEREMPAAEELIRQLDSATNRFPTNPPPAAPNQTNAPPGPVNSSKPAANPSGLSLEIRCTNEVLKVGDEIPIEFILSNHGTEDYKYIDHTYWRSDRWDEYKLTAKTASGEAVPCQSENYKAANWSGALEFRVLHPGESFSKIFALNCWALIMEPGRYEVSGSYLGIPSADPKIATANSASIRLTILPRTKEEMHDYVMGLSNQIAARLPIKQDKSGTRNDPVLNDLLGKLMYTCSPEMIPTQLGIMYEPGPRGNQTDLPAMALLYYVPHTKETGEAILQAAAREGLNWTMYSLLSGYDFNQEELKPLIERALGALNPGEWEIGAALAAYNCYDNAFTAPLIAIASGSNNPINARAEAVRALACNRTDAGLKALKTLLNDPDPRIGASLVEALQAGYSPVKTQPGKHLRPGDFEAAEVRPLMERLLASPANGQEGLNAMEGVNLARMFPDDTLTPKLVALAKKPGFTYRVYAICALALNRTDEGVQTLKMLLNDPEQRISDLTEDAIRYAYTARGEEKGRPLRPDDFDAKFQQPEAPPAK